jgi:hypothetical protein
MEQVIPYYYYYFFCENHFKRYELLHQWKLYLYKESNILMKLIHEKWIPTGKQATNYDVRVLYGYPGLAKFRRSEPFPCCHKKDATVKHIQQSDGK